ncbi:hypothetical protein [Streptomyces sp. NPDC051636]|uniref:hypothetical protein n=1 Tax=Streptomyces sp. NPDC051636 TaxID=3365663 RepID=UPI0037A86B13
MNTKALVSLADLICRAQGQDRTPMGIAFAIDAAGRHMSPETADELERLRVEVAALREERHSTNESLDDAVQALRAAQKRIVGLEQRAAGEPLPVMVSPREPVEDLYDYQRRHPYRLGRDLPPLDGVQ